MVIYVSFNPDGSVDTWSSIRTSDTELEIEVPDGHPFLDDNPSFYVYTNGNFEKSEDLLTQKAKETKLAELRQKCNETILGRFPADVDGVTYWFSCDTEAQANFDKVDRAFDKGRMTQIGWTAYTADGEVVRLTLDAINFEPVYLGHLYHIQANIAKLRDMLQPRLESVTTAEEVMKISW